MLDSDNKDLLKDRELLEQFNDEGEPQEEGWFKATVDFFVETVKIVVLAAAIILPIRYFLVQPFYVKGASMEPNFFDHEYLMINEIGYRFNNPVRGEVVVFKYPKDPKQFFIKRVIGLPGDIIEIKEDRVYVSEGGVGDPILFDEGSYLPKDVTTKKKSDTARYMLEEGQFFLLGDNRNNSLDSRSFGPVDINLIVGKVWFRGWPIDRIEVFN
jgi:signal peptidase I